MNEVIAVFISMIVAFGIGFGAMLMLAGKLPLHYILVKMGRGKKLLIFADTPTGRKSYVGKIEGNLKEGVVSWNYNGSKKMTELKGNNEGVVVNEVEQLTPSDGTENVTEKITKTRITASNIGRFFGVQYMSVNVESPLKPYNLTILGEIPHSSIDLRTYQNLLERAMTRPLIDEDRVLKLIKIVLVGLVIVAIMVIVCLVQIGTINTTLRALAVI